MNKIFVRYLGLECLAEIKGVGRILLKKNDEVMISKEVFDSELKGDYRWELVKEKKESKNKIEEEKI